MSTDALVADLVRLRAALAAVRLPLPLPGAGEALATRDEAVAQVDDYLLPRLADLDAPLLAVLGGSTGAGKSTLTNSLLGEEVTQAGVIRPTTRAPVLAHHPDDTAWFTAGGVLADLPRSTGVRPDAGGLHLVASDAVPRGLGLLDSPDIDSIEVANHDLATQLLGAADLWLFTTTATRYADAVPWRYLARASERAAAVAVVVNRIPPSPDGAAEREIAADVRRLLDAHGLAYAHLFTITEDALVDGRITDGIRPLRDWIDGLVADAEARADLVRHTLEGAVASLGPRTERVLTAVREQRAAAAALEDAVRAGVDAATGTVADQLGSGVLLRGEVLDRFTDHVGTAAWMERLQRGVGALRDRIAGLFTGSPPPVEAARGQLRTNLAGLIDDALATGREQAEASWRRLPGGAELLAAAGAPARGQGTAEGPAAVDAAAVDAAVADWQDEVVAMVRDRAGRRVALARGVSLGVNGVGVTLMVGLFASTGGLTGGEVAVAGGTAAVSQAVLTAVLGEQAVRDLATAARRSLLARVEALAATVHQPLSDAVAPLLGVEVEDALAAAARAVAR